MTSETGAPARGEERPLASDAGDEPTGITGSDSPDDRTTEVTSDAGGATDEAGETASGPTKGRRSRPRGDAGRTGSPVVRVLTVVLGVVLVLLLAAGGYLWSTRPGKSAVSTEEYGVALQTARSAVVDFTSFDYLTLDDDIEQIRRVSTGDLRDETVSLLEGKRDAITQSQTVVNSEIVGAGVTSADSHDATVVLVVEATQQSTASPKPVITRYGIEVTMKKDDGRWLLSGLTGTDNPGNE